MFANNFETRINIGLSGCHTLAPPDVDNAIFNDAFKDDDDEEDQMVPKVNHVYQ
jgi:hypothetical protein